MFNFKDVFEIENGEVIINEHILNVPVLRAVKQAYVDPMPAFKYLRYRYDLKGPYSDAPEDEKDEILLKDFPGDYTLEDPVMTAAIAWFNDLITPTQRYYLDSKYLMEKLGRYGRTSEVTDGRDGNVNALLAQMKGVGKTITEFKQLEKIVDQELEDLGRNRNRGGHESSYDDD